ncbi:hypothetical protein OKW21_001461 [Catalinimonas alkaloidigena]|uniref:hypothetical protein n=1 Tax=Catalinimonas alkaloidigena TaxID=1075417 RepID=UPI0024059ABE|nr:hypothetical protein [Catalinimonas alkaloidigena]MDF9796198.1 hypothetical protein [Catalinimonas alkaloidigena]
MESSLPTPKEQIGNLHFIRKDVLNTALKKAKRKYQLRRAMLLGNLYHGKVNIKFRDEKNVLHNVETTVWTVGEKYISLKGGRTIPVWAIEDIEF